MEDPSIGESTGRAGGRASANLGTSTRGTLGLDHQGLRRPGSRARPAGRRCGSAVGAAFVRVLTAEGEVPDFKVPGVVVAYDMRPSSPGLARAFAAGQWRPKVSTSRSSDSRAHRRALLRIRAARSSWRDVHSEPQPRSVQRHQALPRLCGPRRTRVWPSADHRAAGGGNHAIVDDHRTRDRARDPR